MSDSGEAAASDAHDRPNWLVYPAESYQFREESLEIGRGLIFETANEIIKKRIRAYNRVGLRVTVCGVILCHRNGFPHIIVLRDSEGRLGLLGGKCKAYDGPEEALRQKLARFVSTSRKGTLQLDLRANADNVVVGELLGEFWRPEYDSDILPYLPLHVNRPREKILVYQVGLGRVSASS
ncbi:mRNA cleavage factor-like protein, putative [Babesia caballi]|uniref:mRNA cleavage factor-like protein, putative n=1 Tax=Babesia caballi TaxID=5871 RepID=A0AAV4LM75_BABCB|nr:mRNA cleavage factor-like protein, putative [Babesia caballi]